MWHLNFLSPFYLASLLFDYSDFFRLFLLFKSWIVFVFSSSPLLIMLSGFTNVMDYHYKSIIIWISRWRFWQFSRFYLRLTFITFHCFYLAAFNIVGHVVAFYAFMSQSDTSPGQHRSHYGFWYRGHQRWIRLQQTWWCVYHADQRNIRFQLELIQQLPWRCNIWTDG